MSEIRLIDLQGTTCLACTVGQYREPVEMYPQDFHVVYCNTCKHSLARYQMPVS